MKMDSATEWARKAKEWRKNNPKAWEYMERLAAADVAAGRRVSMARLVEQCRTKDFATENGEAFKINNNYCPAFSRLMVNDHPTWADSIETRRSRFDELV